MWNRCKLLKEEEKEERGKEGRETGGLDSTGDKERGRGGKIGRGGGGGRDNVDGCEARSNWRKRTMINIKICRERGGEGEGGGRGRRCKQ